MHSGPLSSTPASARIAALHPGGHQSDSADSEQPPSDQPLMGNVEPMKTRILSIIVAAALSAAAVSAQAANVGQNFDVKVNLTAVCLTNNAAPAAVDFGTYTAFGSASIPAPASAISFKCTKNVTISSVTLDGPTPLVAGLTYALTGGPDSQPTG